MSTIDELIDFMHSLESDHLPDGWPAVRMQQITMLLNEIEALRQERDGLRADVDRLDWISRQSLIDLRLAMETDNSHDGEVSVCGDGQKIYYGKTLRAAIDNAMAKEQGDGN